MEALGPLREEIAKIDEKILGLVKKRFDSALKIAKVKKDLNMSTRDFKVEKNVLDRNQKIADQLGIDLRVSQEISELLMKYSSELQEKFRNGS